MSRELEVWRGRQASDAVGQRRSLANDLLTS